MKKLFFSVVIMGLALCSNSLAQTVASGSTGECKWSIAGSAGSYTLTISGNGVMADYEGYTQSPWERFNTSIRVFIKNIFQPHANDVPLQRAKRASSTSLC